MGVKMGVAAFVVVLAVTVLNTVQGVDNASSIRATQARLSTTVKKSAATRVTTVTQRCVLTHLDAEFAAAAARIIGEFAPKAVGPFDVLRSGYLVSYQGCLRQLAEVKRINRGAP